MNRTLIEKFGKHCIGQVLRIIDNRTIIIDTTSDTLSVGNSIAIYEVCDELKDLNGKYLCNYEYIKDELEVIETNEYYSVCRKNVLVNQPNLILSPMTSKKVHEPLNIINDNIEPIHVKSPMIKKGDPIKKI